MTNKASRNGITDSDEVYSDALDAHYCCDYAQNTFVPLKECASCFMLMCQACEQTCSDCGKMCCELCIVPNPTAPVACSTTVDRIIALDRALARPFSFTVTAEKLSQCEYAFFTGFRKYAVGKFSNSPETWIFKPPRRQKDIEGIPMYFYAPASRRSDIALPKQTVGVCEIYCGFEPLTNKKNGSTLHRENALWKALVGMVGLQKTRVT